MENYLYANALHNAAHNCDAEELRRCLTPEALAACPIDTRDIGQLTALHALCRYEGPWTDDGSQRVDDRNAEDVEVCVQLLVDAGADLEAGDYLGRSPLHNVAWSSEGLGTEATLRLTSLLLRHGANVNNRADSIAGGTLLHAAASSAPSCMVSLLLKAGAAVNALTDGGDDLEATPLDYAFLYRHRDTLPILLRAGGVLNRYQLRRPDFPQNVLNKSFREYEYLSKVDAGGGFKKYEQAHLATLTKTFEPKFPMLPKEMVRHILTFGFHAGYY